MCTGLGGCHYVCKYVLLLRSGCVGVRAWVCVGVCVRVCVDVYWFGGCHYVRKYVLLHGSVCVCVHVRVCMGVCVRVRVCVDVYWFGRVPSRVQVYTVAREWVCGCECVCV